MSEPIREQLAKAVERVRLYLNTRAEVMPGQVHHDAIADIDMGSQGHVRLLASDVEALLAVLSEVGGVPLDPTPWASTTPPFRFAQNLLGSRQFEPRDGFDQDQTHYEER